MKRTFAVLMMCSLAIGCGSRDKPQVDAAPDPNRKPTTDEARLCISDYLHQFGWKDVDFADFAEQSELPSHAKTDRTAWAYQFSATHRNIFGEAQKTQNWVALVVREKDTPKVLCCYDDAKQLISGHAGFEESEKAALTPAPTPAAELPAIIAPKP